MIFAIIAFFSICAYFISADITGETVTGKLSSQTLALNITVTIPIPVLSIISPENETYLTNESLLLNYSATNADMVWYNIDLAGSNTTITDSVYFNVSQGAHTLYLYANNSYGSASENVSFFANSSYLIILYSKYNGSTKGSSTNFTSHSYKNLQNLNNIILENSVYGKIRFNEAINVTNDLIPEDLLIDLDTNTNISSNRIELNSIALPNFNKSATLWLYGLSFSNPRILKDGAVCPSTICTQESYSGETGILKFNVTGFSVYSAEETPAETAAPTGGGGGKKIIRGGEFTTDKESIKIQSKKGGTIKTTLEIKNPSGNVINFNLSSNLEDMLIIKEKIFTLNPKEGKNISLTFFSTADTPAGVYTGEIIVKGNLITKIIPVIFEVESKDILFDVSLNIPPKYKELIAGKELVAQLTLFKIGEIEKADVFVNLSVKDFNGNTILTKGEKITVETQLSISRNITLPEKIIPGDYVLIAEVIHSEEVGTSSETFKVLEKGLFKKNRLMWVSLAILIILIIIILIEDKRIKEVGSYKKIFAEKIEKAYENEARKRQISRLNMQAEALKKAYREGHITKDSYEKGISRLRGSLKK